MIGQALSHFRVTEKLGEGGMGAVYRAVDTRLHRQVAIKVLPEALAGDPERLARLEREARALAALNHPGIVAIHSLETVEPADGGEATRFLVMELVEGKTLAEEIPAGGLAFDRFFRLAVPIAGTLAVAHERGIVHRDLKPGNIMVTSSGAIKVLDFGLAKRSLNALEVTDDTPTETYRQLTEKDEIVGTGPYMSPEQIRSRPLDERSDLFSLGVVLFEMLSAQKPFRGDSSVDLISSILKDEPRDLGELRPDVSESLRQLVERCLEKDARARFASAIELRDRLAEVAEEVLETGESGPGTDAASRPEGARELDSRAVAVLPFANLSGTEEADLLATGLHNDVISELSRITGLTVISRTSVMAYHDTAKPVREIGRELGVGTIIEGTVQSAGSLVRLTAQLIDATEDVQRWAERYDRELSMEGLFDLQSEVTRQIVDSLQSEFAPTLEVPSGEAGTDDIEAYRLATMGRVQVERRTESGLRRAVELFGEATERDPDYASAWAGLSEALAISVWYGYVEPEDRLERAGEAAHRAVELDPDSAEAHCALATALGAVRNGPEAMRELQLAVQLQPSFWDAHNRLSYFHHLHGRADLSLEAAKRAVEINPLSAEAVANLALSLLTNGELERSLREARRTAELSPGWTTADFYQALTLYELGRYDEAEGLLSGLHVEWAGLGAEATLTLTYVAMDDEGAAREVLDTMDLEVDAFAVGFVHLAMGEIETAFGRFSEVEELNDWACLAVHHLYRDIWEPVRDDPRYGELVRVAYETHDLDPPDSDRREEAR